MNCKFTIKENEKKAIWEITNQCNYNCEYCIFSSTYKKDNNELNTVECKKILDELAKEGFTHLKITGGEPFIRKDIVELLEYGYKKGLIVDVSTNASIISDEDINKLSNIELKMIHISLDGDNEEIQGLVRVKNTFERTIEGIKKFAKTTHYIRIGTVIFEGNSNRLEEIINLVISLGVNEIIFSIMEPVGRMLGNDEKVFKGSISDLTHELEELRKKYRDRIVINYNWENKQNNSTLKCPAGKDFIYINNVGKIAPCTWAVIDSNKYFSTETFKNKTLKELLNDDAIVEFRKKTAGDCIVKK